MNRFDLENEALIIELRARLKRALDKHFRNLYREASAASAEKIASEYAIGFAYLEREIKNLSMLLSAAQINDALDFFSDN